MDDCYTLPVIYEKTESNHAAILQVNGYQENQQKYGSSTGSHSVRFARRTTTTTTTATTETNKRMTDDNPSTGKTWMPNDTHGLKTDEEVWNRDNNM
jgi:hypothetical protein